MILTREDIMNRLDDQTVLRDRGFRGAISDYGLGKRGLSASPHSAGMRSEESDDSDFKIQIENLHPSLMSVSGLDLRVGDVFQIPAIRRFNTLADLDLAHKSDFLKRIEPDQKGKITLKHDPTGNSIYLITSLERLQIPFDLELKIDARSTTGRLGCLCEDVSSQVFKDGSDTPAPILAVVRPYAFDLEVTPGSSRLMQAVIRRRQSPYMTHNDIVGDTTNIGLSFQDGRSSAVQDHLTDEGLRLTYKTDRIFLAREREEPIDVDARGKYDSNEYFDLIEGKSSFRLPPRKLALLATQEVLRQGNVVGFLTRDSMSSGNGLWGHLAGIAQPGYHGPLTMECLTQSCHDIQAGDPATFVRFDKLPRKLQNNELYAGQYQGHNAPMLPGQFKKIS